MKQKVDEKKYAIAVQAFEQIDWRMNQVKRELAEKEEARQELAREKVAREKTLEKLKAVLKCERCEREVEMWKENEL